MPRQISPFMVVAGDHATNDMADTSDPDSWASKFTAAGIETTCLLEGLGQYSGIDDTSTSTTSPPGDQSSNRLRPSLFKSTRQQKGPLMIKPNLLIVLTACAVASASRRLPAARALPPDTAGSAAPVEQGSSSASTKDGAKDDAASTPLSAADLNDGDHDITVTSSSRMFNVKKAVSASPTDP